LDEGKPRRHELSPDLKMHMKTVYTKLKKLVKSVEHYEHIFRRKEPERSYAAFAKQPPTQARYIRVGSPVGSDEDSDADGKDKWCTNKLIQTMYIRILMAEGMG
jgi:hypothetical protein